MLSHNYTVQEISQIVADNAKTKKWLSASYPVLTDIGPQNIGIKSFGKWVQLIQINQFKDGLPELKTIRAVKIETEKLIKALIHAAGIRLV